MRRAPAQEATQNFIRAEAEARVKKEWSEKSASMLAAKGATKRIINEMIARG